MITINRGVHVYAGCAALSLLIGVMMMLGSRGYAQPHESVYEKYVSKDPKIGIATQRLAAWSASESRGSYEPYAMVVFFEPERGEKGRRAEMVVSVTQSAEAKIDPTLDAMTVDLLGRRQQLPGYKVLAQTQDELLGVPAMQVELSYRVPASLHALEKREHVIREKVVLFVRGARLYQLRYVNTEGAYPAFEEAFEHLIASLTFLP